jgi:hypothetical protein
MAFLQDYASDMLWITAAVLLVAWVGLKKSKKKLEEEDSEPEEPPENTDSHEKD